MRNKIIDKRSALEAALETVRYQIKYLKPFYAHTQIREWYRRRNSLVRQLKGLPTPEQLEASSRRHSAIVKSIIHRK